MLTHENPGHILPTMEGKSSGVISHKDRIVSVQCAVCFKVTTGRTILAVSHANFTPDEEHGQPPTKYRRCKDCQEAKRHPEGINQ